MRRNMRCNTRCNTRKTILIFMVLMLAVTLTACLDYIFSPQPSVEEPADETTLDPEDEEYVDEIVEPDGERPKAGGETPKVGDEIPGFGEEPLFLSVSGTIASFERLPYIGVEVNPDDFDYSIDENIVYFNVDDEFTLFLFGDSYKIGDRITGWYRSDIQMFDLHPPVFYIGLLAINMPDDINVKIDFFSARGIAGIKQYISQDGTLIVSINDNTEVVFIDDYGNPIAPDTDDFSNRILIVVYGSSSGSVPDLTIATKVLVGPDMSEFDD